MSQIGIDQLHFYTSDYFIDMADFAAEKGEDPAKFSDGIGQDQMAVIPPDEDVVTLAANAAKPIVDAMDKNTITGLLFATETAIDQSKSAGLYVHRLLGLGHHCRQVELKQACYAGTAAVQMAVGLVARNHSEKILVVASDVARYDLNSSGEATQGCGAIALLITADPSIVAIDPESGYYSDDVMDFWRPNYRTSALVDGKYSAKIYIQALKHSWQHFQQMSHRVLDEISHFCYHLPFSKMANKAHRQLLRMNRVTADEALMDAHIKAGQVYNRQIGNSYTASLYIALASLLDQAQEDLSNKRVGFFSYGSGCVSEFFTGLVLNGYRDTLRTSNHLRRLKNRIRLTYGEYVDFYHYQLPTDGSEAHTPHFTKGAYRLSGIKDHQRQYEVMD